jgi:hypothetical protein
MRMTWALAMAGLSALAAFAVPTPSLAGRYSVACIAPNGPWCRIACTSNRGVACYANVQKGRCIKFCRYR